MKFNSREPISMRYWASIETLRKMTFCFSC